MTPKDYKSRQLLSIFSRLNKNNASISKVISSSVSIWYLQKCTKTLVIIQMLSQVKECFDLLYDQLTYKHQLFSRVGKGSSASFSLPTHNQHAPFALEQC